MGFLRRLFTPEPQYPPLKASDPVARRITKNLRPLEHLVQSGAGRVEIVPGERRSYVFLGNPPKRFGFAWIENGTVRSFELGHSPDGRASKRRDRFGNELQRAYSNSRNDRRYRVRVSGQTVVVTPSRKLEDAVEEVLAKAIR